MKKPPPMSISHATASHLPVLESGARAATGLVVEHGAGLYSTPLLARLGCRVRCIESHPGWSDWARWIYEGRAEFSSAPDITDATLVFIDGVAEERGPLLSACIAAGVPTIIAHDTGEKTRGYYGYEPYHFMVTRYDVTHPAPRTTLWKLKPPIGVPFGV